MHTSFCPEGLNVRFASCFLKDGALNWWEEVDRALGGELVESISWDDIVTRFRDEFTYVIEVQQLAREF